MNMHQDAAFLSLLSSQRQLLNQLNKEKEMRQSEASVRPTPPPSKHRRSPYINRARAPDFITWNNAPVVNHAPYHQHQHRHPYPYHDQHYEHQQHYRRTSLDLLLTGARRFSLGPPPENMLLPNLSNDDGYGHGSLLDLSGHSRISVNTRNVSNKRGRIDESENGLFWKKRRMSSLGLGFLSDAVLEEDMCKGRRLSILSGKKEEPFCKKVDPTRPSSPDSKSDHSATCSEDEEDSLPGVPTKGKDEAPRLDPAEMRKHIMDFSNSMEKSQQSQQDIHDWDRKMGLKRSHSKTMRMSTRSRKELKAAFKKEISRLTQKSN